jgi:hypothetical protein
VEHERLVPLLKKRTTRKTDGEGVRAAQVGWARKRWAAGKKETRERWAVGREGRWAKSGFC